MRRVPRFGFDFVDGGATEEHCIKRNVDAFQAVELMPRYCIEGKANTEVTLFGRKYAAPIGVAPMGSAGLMWPGAEKMFAAEAQKQKIPYVLATPGNASIEKIAAIAPDVFWFQLYRFPHNDHTITYASDAAATHLGCDVDALIGTRFTDFCRPGASRRGVEEALRRTSADGDAESLRHELQLPGGESRC